MALPDWFWEPTDEVPGEPRWHCLRCRYLSHVMVERLNDPVDPAVDPFGRRCDLDRPEAREAKPKGLIVCDQWEVKLAYQR